MTFAVPFDQPIRKRSKASIEPELMVPLIQSVDYETYRNVSDPSLYEIEAFARRGERSMFMASHNMSI